MAVEREQHRDITLPPDSYLFLVNEAKGGIITVHRGPTVVNQTGQDQPVRYNHVNRTYENCDLAKAVQICPRANEGDYVVLENPGEGNQFPTACAQQAVNLHKGRKVIIPGPWSEALWPGQVANVIEGHRLRSNQYLVAIIYNADEAKKNWETGTVAISQNESDASKKDNETSADSTKPVVVLPQSKGLPRPENFAVGSRIVIKGSDVSFYIPCTGVEVLRDKDNKYVREAVTLEQLEYACLVDESGKKEYPRGPKVVFPRPTQVFDEDKRGRRKFRPIELNAINGIHLKVTADFTGPDIENDCGKERPFYEGEELFVTGKTLSIYYPREELSVIEYGQGNKKHFSTAIPKGEGRYVINRNAGHITLCCGPKMLLPDPRKEILVRRILSQEECELWYPGNVDAKAYNLELAKAMSESPSGRSGVISEGDYRKRQQNASPSSLKSHDSTYEEGEETYDDSNVSSIVRGSKHMQPRSLTLNTKFDGVPRIEIWPGFAVLIVGAEGQRRVAMGPQVVLLEYDEKLGFMKLSTGKPKSTDHYFKTVYLCVDNNQVGDVVSFETKDHVKGSLKISLRVNFEANSPEERLRWWSVDNYVKFLTDHVRSIIAGMAQKLTVAEFKADYVNLVREAILGKKSEQKEGQSLQNGRPGLYFESNGMRVVELEVLEMALSDINIAKLLDHAQHKVVETNIRINEAYKDFEALKSLEEIERAKALSVAETARIKRELEKTSIEEQKSLFDCQLEMEMAQIQAKKRRVGSEEEIVNFRESQRLERAKKETDYLHQVDTSKAKLEAEKLDAATQAAVSRFGAARDGLHEVMLAMQREDMVVKLAEGCNIERYLSGDNHVSAISNLLSISPTLAKFFDRATGAQDKKVDSQE